MGALAVFNSRFQVGEPAPWFIVQSPTNPRFHFDSVAGRRVVLSFIGSGQDPIGRQVLADVRLHANRFDGDNLAFFAVSVDPTDQQQYSASTQWYGFNFFWDMDRQVSRLYGAAGESGQYNRFSVVLDERLRVLAVVPLGENPADHVAQLLRILQNYPPLPSGGPATMQAPVLVVPRVFEPELCRTLMDYYKERGGKAFGFMSEVDGKTVEIRDTNFKRRSDQMIEDEQLRKTCMFRLHDRLVPEIQKAFNYKPTRIERYVVACYDSAEGGHFRAHRDNTTKGTAHRRFAVSLNLNTGEYEGGNLRFPEYGLHTYAAPAGGAVVFSCSLLHEATPVTKGKRYAFLPFLYDDQAAAIRQENLQYLVASPANVGTLPSK